MAKTKTAYVCTECGYDSPKWYGKCPSCGSWNTMAEELDWSEARRIAEVAAVTATLALEHRILEEAFA